MRDPNNQLDRSFKWFVIALIVSHLILAMIGFAAGRLDNQLNHFMKSRITRARAAYDRFYGEGAFDHDWATGQLRDIQADIERLEFEMLNGDPSASDNINQIQII